MSKRSLVPVLLVLALVVAAVIAVLLTRISQEPSPLSLDGFPRVLPLDPTAGPELAAVVTGREPACVLGYAWRKDRKRQGLDPASWWQECEGALDALEVWTETRRGFVLEEGTKAQPLPSMNNVTDLAGGWLARGRARAETGDIAGAVRDITRAARLSGTLQHAWDRPGGQVALGLGRSAGDAAEQLLGEVSPELWSPLLNELRWLREHPVDRRAVVQVRCMDNLVHLGDYANKVQSGYSFSPVATRALTLRHCAKARGYWSAPPAARPEPLPERDASFVPLPNWLGRMHADSFAAVLYSEVHLFADQQASRRALLGSAIARLQAEAAGGPIPEPWLDPWDSEPIGWDATSRTFTSRAMRTFGERKGEPYTLALPQ